MSGFNVHNRRIMLDVKKLMSNGYQLYFSAGSLDEIFVIFHGPEDSYYRNGIWKLRIRFPPQYPYKGPLVSFCNYIYHPNVESKAGAICLNFLSKDWSPVYDLLSILNEFIPDLLRNPNAGDPYNTDAARLYNKDKDDYGKMVQEHISKFASDIQKLLPEKIEFEKNSDILESYNIFENGDNNNDDNNDDGGGDILII